MKKEDILSQLKVLSNKKFDAENIDLIDTQNNFTSTHVEGALSELHASQESLKQSVSSGKGVVASAITDKGVPTLATDSFQQMATNIGNIAGFPDGWNVEKSGTVINSNIKATDAIFHYQAPSIEQGVYKSYNQLEFCDDTFRGMSADIGISDNGEYIAYGVVLTGTTRSTLIIQRRKPDGTWKQIARTTTSASTDIRSCTFIPGTNRVIIGCYTNEYMEGFKYVDINGDQVSAINVELFNGIVVRMDKLHNFSMSSDGNKMLLYARIATNTYGGVMIFEKDIDGKYTYKTDMNSSSHNNGMPIGWDKTNTYAYWLGGGYIHIYNSLTNTWTTVKNALSGKYAARCRVIPLSDMFIIGNTTGQYALFDISNPESPNQVSSGEGNGYSITSIDVDSAGMYVVMGTTLNTTSSTKIYKVDKIKKQLVEQNKLQGCLGTAMGGVAISNIGKFIITALSDKSGSPNTEIFDFDTQPVILPYESNSIINLAYSNISVGVSERDYSIGENATVTIFPKLKFSEVVKNMKSLETRLLSLEDSQNSQDDAILQSMLGTAEVCEMVLILQEQINSTNPVLLNTIEKLGGASAMIEVYANLVLAGKYTVNPEEVTGSVKLVPSVYREEVKKKLAEWAI